MDDYLDHFLSSATWSGVNGKESSYWGSGESDQVSGLLPNSFGLDEEDKYSSPLSLESLAAQDTSTILLKGEPDHGLDQDFRSAQLQLDGQNCNDHIEPNRTINGGLGSVHLGSEMQLPMVGEMARSSVSVSFTESGLVGCSGNKPSEFQRPIRDLQTLSLIPQLWPPPSYDSFSSLFPVMGEERVQNFDLPGKQVSNGTDLVMNGYVGLDKAMEYDSLSATISRKAKQDLDCNFVSSFAAGPQISMKSAGLNSLHQTTPTTTSGGCNGTAKPRQRARRGQATDPHSIAERLRREKIAERMKNLQELVPNSNKTDKASMLDEIIDYVKFLQLQVKVLSMSRLGAAGAVLPLITDSQAEGSSNGLSLSPSAGQVVDDPSQIAFEQEIVKLMESSVSMAMQYLQSKGLCLMPIALAAAISSGKASSSSSPALEDSLVQNTVSSSNSSSSLPPMASDGGNACSRAVKQEVKSAPRDIKPKA